MTTETPDEVLANAKVHFMCKQGGVFFSRVSMLLEHKISLEIPTAATNGKYVIYNPNFFMGLSKEERVGLICHECAHVAFLHMFRIGDRDPKIWNLAGDYVINGVLITAGFKIPECGLHDPQFDGWSTDQVYEYLIQNNIEPPIDYKGDIITSSDDPVTTEELEQEVTNIVIRAVQQTKLEGGNVPQEIAVTIETLINPKLNWQEILLKWADSHAKDNYTWSRPNKRYTPQYYLPNRYSAHINSLVGAIDTSGSMTKELLQEILTNLEYINTILKPEKFIILDCDAAIHNIYEVEHGDSILNLHFSGGGGTSVLPILDYIKETSPYLVIYFTDGDMDLTVPTPECEFLWAVGGNKDFKQPFGDLIHVDN